MNTRDDDPSDRFNFEFLSRLYERSSRYLLLLGGVILVGLFLALLAIALLPRQFTAIATVAPATSLGSSDLNGSALSGAASALSALSGRSLSGTSQVSPYEMYLDVLTSKRLAQQLADNDHFLQIVFYRQWDARAGRWKSATGFFHSVVRSLKTVIGLTPKDHPDVDDLARFLTTHLVIASKESASAPFSAISEISFRFRDPHLARQMLGDILNEADSILRAGRRVDVQARITYLSRTIPTVMLAEQRQALIAVLSSEEEQYTVLEADKRYASILLDPPFAPVEPTFPSPLLVIIGFLIGSIGLWLMLVAFAPEGSLLMRMFATKRKRVGVASAVDDPTGYASRAKSTS